MFIYQEKRRYFAQVAGGLEETGGNELAELGAKRIKTGYRGVFFEADRSTVYKIVYQTRLATRVLAPLISFRCRTEDVLYEKVSSINWQNFMTLDETFAVNATVSNSRLDHSQYAALKVKDAVVDQFRNEFGKRPDIDTRTPNVWINLHIEQDLATISIDLAGGSLHRRGYKVESIEAPMQETVAAAVIRFSEWKGERPMLDLMCGSGTLLCEAVMHYADIPAGFLRKRFGFECLPDFDRHLWKAIRSKVDGRIKEVPAGLISGSDRSMGAVRATRANLKMLPGGQNVHVTQEDYRDITAIDNTDIITNPPYGLRLGHEAEMAAFFKEFGDFLKQKCTGSTAYVYFGERKWMKKIGLRTMFKKPLVNGQLDGRLTKYELY